MVERTLAICFPLDTAFNRGVASGIVAYALTRAGVRTLVADLDLPRLAERAACDALVVRSAASPLLALAAVRRKTVLISAQAVPGVQRVWVDDAAAGCLAARHALAAAGDRRHAAFRGDPRCLSIGARQRAFLETMRAGGVAVHPFEPGAELLTRWSLPRERRANIAFLRALPRPFVVGGYDASTARRILHDCQEAGLQVPHDAAVVAAEDDPLVCGLCRPAVTAVVIPAERLGWLAAERLLELIDGQRRAEPVLVPPTEVVSRGSLGEPALPRPLLAALATMSGDPARRTGVVALARAAGLSRRALERRFRAEVGRGPAAELRRRRLQRARNLLREPLPLAEVARRSGFADASSFSHAFRRAFGCAPGAWRRGLASAGSDPQA